MTIIFDRLQQMPPGTVDVNSVLGVKDRGTVVVLSGAAAIPANTFVAGDMVGVLNNTAGPITISAGEGLALRLENSALTGNRTLASQAMASIWFLSPNVAYITGGGVS